MYFPIGESRLTINWEKSSLTPLTVCEFLGIVINSLTMTMHLPMQKSQELIRLCVKMKNLKSLFLRSLYKAVGKLRATSPAISLAPLQIRGLQQCLIQSLRKGKTYESQVTLDSEAVKEVKWWIINLQIIQGKPISLIPPEAQVRIATDASKTAWGAHRDGGETIGDQWSPSERTQHINVLELVAVELALFFKEQTPVSVHLQIDNLQI